MDIDAVANAIAAADPCYYGDQHDYRRMAQAAIDALGLTQEWAFEFTEPLSGNRKHYLMPEVEARKHAAEAQPNRDAAALSRLVSRWVRDEASLQVVPDDV